MSHCSYHMLMTLIIFFSLSFPIIAINGLEGQKRFEDLDLDQQLKILSKPHVKSIESEEGDIFDCVKIRKQPAFDHPLLRNHKIQVKPSSSFTGMATATSPSTKQFDIGCRSIGCPSGTVPIKRTRKEDLVKAKMFMKNLMIDVYPYTITRSPGFHYAITILHSNASEKYFGASGKLNLQNPTVSRDQFSEAFLRIQSEANNQTDIIQTGWMVNPTLRGDNLTRSCTLWTSGKSGCLDLMCPGFVQVDQKISLNSNFTQTSVYGGEQYDFQFGVFQDRTSGNWWLNYGSTIVGYWPKSLFKSLSSSVDEVIWGGGVFSGTCEASPVMGSGHFVEEDVKKAAYIRQIKIVDKFKTLRDPDIKYLQLYSDNSQCYNICPLQGHKGFGVAFLYGGPGGNRGM